MLIGDFWQQTDISKQSSYEKMERFSNSCDSGFLILSFYLQQFTFSIIRFSCKDYIVDIADMYH